MQRKFHSRLIQYLKLTPLQPVILAFFVLSIVMLFVGDGKQHVIDLLGIVYSLAAYFYLKLQTKNNNSTPHLYNLFWIAVIGSSILSTFLSSSVGNSFSALVRVFISYNLFTLILQYKHSKDTQNFSQLILYFSVVATCISTILTFFPDVINLSSMNLIYPSYGHNHIADILLIALPIALYRLILRKSRLNIFILVVILLGLSLSFSRGALFISGLYILFKTGLLWKKLNIAYRTALIIIGFLFVQSLLIFSFTSLHAKFNNSTLSVSRLSTKPDLRSDGRQGYWQQALSGYWKSPAVGTGPGTFFLISKKYQNKPNAYSWFAHSFPLETLTETGIIGLTTLFLFLFYLLIKSYISQQTGNEVNTEINSGKSLLQGILLTLLYSLIEFNLNYLLIWMLFWLSLAFIAPSNNNSRTDKIQKFTSFTTIIFLMYYYISSMFLLIFPKNIIQQSKIPLYIAPFSVTRTQILIENMPVTHTLTQTEYNIIRFFHKNDPEILFALAQYEKKRRNFIEATILFQKAIDADSRNEAYHEQYVKLLLERKEGEKIISWLRENSVLFLPNRFRNDIQSLPLHSVNILQYEKEIQMLFDRSLSNEIRHARLYYLIGLDNISTNPELTQKYWSVSLNLQPDTSYFYVELAALYDNVLHKSKQALHIMDQCLQNEFARNHCKDVLNSEIPAPGSLKREILKSSYE